MINKKYSAHMMWSLLISVSLLTPDTWAKRSGGFGGGGRSSFSSGSSFGRSPSRSASRPSSNWFGGGSPSPKRAPTPPSRRVEAPRRAEAPRAVAPPRTVQQREATPSYAQRPAPNSTGPRVLQSAQQREARQASLRTHTPAPVAAAPANRVSHITGKAYRSSAERRRAEKEFRASGGLNRSGQVRSRRTQYSRSSDTVAVNGNSHYGYSPTYGYYSTWGGYSGHSLGMPPAYAYSTGMMDTNNFLLNYLILSSLLDNKREVPAQAREYQESETYKKLESKFHMVPKDQYMAGDIFKVPSNLILGPQSLDSLSDASNTCAPQFDATLILESVLGGIAYLKYIPSSEEQAGNECALNRIIQLSVVQLGHLNQQWQREALAVMNKERAQTVATVGGAVEVDVEAVTTSSGMNICGSTESGNYTKAADIVSDAINKFDVTVVETEGSGEIYDKVSDKKCNFGIIQGDALFQKEKGLSSVGQEKIVQVVSEVDVLFTEYPLFVCDARKGIRNVSDLTDRHSLVIAGSANSGSGITWHTIADFAGPSAEFTKVKTTYADNKRALNDVAFGLKTCALITTAPQSWTSQYLKNLKQDGVVLNFAQINLSDLPLNSQSSGFQFEVESIPAGAFGNDDSIQSLAIPAYLVENVELNKGDAHSSARVKTQFGISKYDIRSLVGQQ